MESGKIFATLYLSLFKFNTGKNYPEIKGELQGFRQALEQYAMALAVAVPCGVKDKAMGMLDSLVKEEQGDQQ